MMKTLLVGLLTVSLVGCGSTNSLFKPSPEIVYVDRIVTKECPVPDPTPLPLLEIYNLKQDSKTQPGQVAKAWKASVERLQGEVLSCHATLDGYRVPTLPTKE